MPCSPQGTQGASPGLVSCDFSSGGPGVWALWGRPHHGPLTPLPLSYPFPCNPQAFPLLGFLPQPGLLVRPLCGTDPCLVGRQREGGCSLPSLSSIRPSSSPCPASHADMLIRRMEKLQVGRGWGGQEYNCPPSSDASWASCLSWRWQRRKSRLGPQAAEHPEAPLTLVGCSPATHRPFLGRCPRPVWQ